jgi:integrase
MTAIHDLANRKGYWSRPVIDGKKHYVQHKRKGEVERQVALLKEKARMRKLGLPDPFEVREPITFGQGCDKHLEQYQYSARSKRTLKERQKLARDTFEDVLVQDITTEALLTWNAKLPVGQTTRHNAWRTVKQTLAFLVSVGYLHSNPTEGQRMQGPAKRKVFPFEDRAQIDAVAAKAGDYGPLIKLMCETGMRPQEALALEWRHIDFGKRELRIEQTVREGKIEQVAKTDESLRTVWLNQRALDTLSNMPRPMGGGLLFKSPTGSTINLSNFRRRVWKKALTDSKTPYRAFDQCRHTYATLMLAGGAPVEWVSRQLGHVKIQTTLAHYARWLPRADERIRALIDSDIRAEAVKDRTESGQSTGATS